MFCWRAPRRLVTLGLQHQPVMPQPFLHDLRRRLDVFAAHYGMAVCEGGMIRRRLSLDARRDAQQQQPDCDGKLQASG